MTKKTVFKGSAAIGNSGIKRHFKNAEPWQPLFELVWNGFDAAASFVSVDVAENEMHGLERVVVLDDGDGIEFDALNDTFGSFNDSAKRTNLSLKGEHGRGRLAFHMICRNASWFTRCNGVDAVIYVTEPTIKDFEGRILEGAEQNADLLRQGKGTLVELTDFTGALPELDALREKFSVEFGWYLAVHPEKQVVLNGVTIQIPEHEAFQKEIATDDAIFQAQVIRWEQRPTSEKSYGNPAQF